MSLETPAPSQKFFIKTFGCQMNVADSERMAALLAERGMSMTEDAADADVILLNGCSVREKAVHKAASLLGTFKPLKGAGGFEGATGKRPVIGMGGCVGSLEKEDLFKRAPYLDFVFGPDNIDQMPELVYRAQHGEKHIISAEFDDRAQNYSIETKVHTASAQAFVNIMKGCDKFCTYCIVPFTRGREKSRTIDEVLQDLARMAAAGVKEITLLGQNVNSFGKGNANVKNRLPLELHNPIGKVGPRAGEENFPQLLRAIDSDPRLAGIKRVRFTSSHPLDFSDELIACYAPASQGGVAKLAPQLHLPVQCGSNRILQKMGRHHTIESYFDQMDRLRALNPDVGFSTDLIVGFPGETEEDFQATLRLLDRVQYDNIYAFAYSVRPGTRAEKLDDDVSDEEKSSRLNRLLAYQLEIGRARYATRVGRRMEILVEGPSKNAAIGNAPWAGRTGCGRVVNFNNDSQRNLTGRFVEVQITGSSGVALVGELIHEPGYAEGLRA